MVNTSIPDQHLKALLQETAASDKPITVMTGAGISAESGIPTFRGPEGYWTVGAKEYHPQEMATHRMFAQKPRDVWTWYLYRMGVCKKAEPNAGHHALVEMENIFKDRFTLITQNVDGLHLRAGSSMERTFQIHGNVFFMRCAQECTSQIYPLPADVPPKNKGEDLTDHELKHLCCPECGAMTRPHVLWFDEVYNEPHFRFQSSLDAAARTALLIIAGTSGSTNLPNQVANVVKQQGGTVIDINIEENLFSRLAVSARQGFFIKDSAAKALPEIAAILSG